MELVCRILDTTPASQAMTKKILVVEDLADIRKMMKIMVELYGYEVIEARDGAEAVEQAREHRPSLVLMDLAMPLMNGVDAARAIREAANGDPIPIIAVTAYQNMDQEAIDAGSTLRIDLADGNGSYFGTTERFWRVYEREGEPCIRCGTKIRRVVQGGRSTYYCPKCQKN